MLNALDNRLRSALHWAALLGRPSVSQMLLDRGAKVRDMDLTLTEII